MRLEEAIKSTFRSEQQKAMLNIMYTGSWIRGRQVGFFRKFGISPEQYNILRILNGADGNQYSMQEIKSRMLFNTPNTTRLTDQLIKKNWIERTRCEQDRRVVYVNINETGKAALERIASELKQDNDPETIISKKDALVVNEILDRIRSGQNEAE